MHRGARGSGLQTLNLASNKIGLAASTIADVLKESRFLTELESVATTASGPEHLDDQAAIHRLSLDSNAPTSNRNTRRAQVLTGPHPS